MKSMAKDLVQLALASGLLWWWAVSAVAGEQQPEKVVTWTACVEPKDLRSGEMGLIVISAQIKPGWHIYGLATHRLASPTSIIIKTNTAFSVCGQLIEGQRKPGDADDILSRCAQFGVPIRISPLSAGKQKSVISVQFQSCSELICHAPETVMLPLTFSVRSGRPRQTHTRMPTTIPTARGH